jgi:hypothetical protein
LFQPWGKKGELTNAESVGEMPRELLQSSSLQGFITQGCFNRGVRKEELTNAESVGEMPREPLQSSSLQGFINPGLKQPWAEISERLRRNSN